MDSYANKNVSSDTLIEQSPILDDIFGEQELFPRVGDDYQVEVPERVTRADYLASIDYPKTTENSALAFRLPVAWTSAASEASRGSQREESERLPLVPPSASWNDAEKASLLLGLYIFEKNFARVRRFVESKQMGDILVFYYGDFYRSPEYCRWSKCRKMKSRRCIYGQKIFAGARLQELLSRIQPNVSEGCKNTLLEVSKMFGEGKMPFEEYVFSLKASVGMNLLVEAVGIGKGKQDLTRMVLKHSKSSNAMRPEMPSGKACSSLTTSEIVKVLTGDFRLSKARSNDLFWEAVWPRLLARGWHSEETKDLGYAISPKNSLVFLVPGINKFSRRGLVKGNHYFDSVTDVLSKVASEPGLIELEDDVDQNKENKEDNAVNNAKLEEDDSAGRRRQFLQPRIPSRTSDDMKFTVVDTSFSGRKKYKVRELSSLLFENPKWNSRDCIEISDDDTSEVSSDGDNDVNTVLRDRSEANNAKASNSLFNGELVSDQKDSPSNTHPLADKQPKRELKHQSSRSMKEGNLDNIAPVTKKLRRSTAYGRGETTNVINKSSAVPSRLEPDMTTCSSSRSSPSGSVDGALQVNSHGAAEPQDVPQSQPLIDLNLPPQLPPDFDYEFFMTYAAGESEDKSKHLVVDDTPRMSRDVTSSEQQSSSQNPQRRSSRTRPPSAKALEAIANGYLTVNSRTAKKKAKAETSRRARGEVGLTEIGSHSMHAAAEGTETSASADKERSTLHDFEVLPEENRAPASGP